MVLTADGHHKIGTNTWSIMKSTLQYLSNSIKTRAWNFSIKLI